MGSGRVGGEMPRRTTTTCSSSPITRASRSRWRGHDVSLSHRRDRAGAGAREGVRGRSGRPALRRRPGHSAVPGGGVLDELELHIVPVLLGDGARLFDNLRGAEIELEHVRAVEAPGVTHLKYRVMT